MNANTMHFDAVLDKLLKLRLRLKGKTALMPSGACKDVDTHLAGLFLKTHIDLFISLLREDRG